MLKVAGIEWVVRKEFEPIVLSAGFSEDKEEELPQSDADGLIKDSSVRKVFRTSVPYAQETLPLVVKIYKDRGLIHRLKFLLRLPKGIAEYLKARELEERGVPTLFALAGGVRRRHLIPTEHFFLSREIAGAKPLHQFIYKNYLNFTPQERLSCKRQFIPALASFVKGLHERGVLHNDFHLGNIMFTRTSSGEFNFFVIDLLAVRLKKHLALAERLNNLALLNAVFKRFFSGADRFRFLKLYAQGDEKIEPHLKKFARIIEEKALRLRFRHRTRRLKRAFSANRYFEKVKAGRLKGFLRREFHQPLSPFIQNPAAFFDPNNVNLLKAGHRTTVAEGKITINGEVKELIFKRYNQKKWIDPFKDLFRHSRAFRAWKMANALFYSGLPVALPIGVFEERRLRWLRHSYLVMEKLKAKQLSEFLQEEFGPVEASGAKPDEVKKKRIILSALARFVRRLHNEGFAHRDLKSSNILASNLSTADSRRPTTIYIIDYDAYRFSKQRRVSARVRLRDLSRMELAASKLGGVVSRTERMRFLKEYLADIRPGKLEFKAWCRDILKRAQKIKKMSLKPEYQRILIVKPSSIGDCVHSLPVLAELRANFPRAHIAWLVARPALDIIEDNPYLNEVFILERDRWRNLRDWPGAWLELLRLLWNIRRQRFDVVIDLQGLFRSGLLSWASGATLRIGFENGREMSRFFYNRRVRVSLDMHSVNRYLSLIEGLVVKGGSPASPAATGGPEFEINFPEEASRRVRGLLKDAGLSQGRILVVLAPGARWLTKRWEPYRFALLAKALTEKYHARIALVGAGEEAPLTRDIERRAGFKTANLAGKINLKELAALLQMADLCVANDTAPLHLAAALNTPTVAIFGPTDPSRTGPYGQLHRVVRSGVFCSPCFSRKCKDLRCLDAICVEDVLERIENLAREMKWPIS